MLHSPRNALIAGGVVLFHVAALWALQNGLLQRVVEVVVPVEVLGALVTPPQPVQPPAPPPPKPIERPAPHPLVVHKAAPVPPPAPRPVASPEPAPPAPNAPVAVSEAQVAPPPISAPVAVAPAPPAPAPAPAPAPRVEQPITNADYLQNPAPVYPRASIRLGEEGTTVVRVLIGPDGRAQEAHTSRSSGFTRLDKAAEETALAWKYVPGKRGGVPEAMWVNVPIKWEIRKDQQAP